MIFELSSMYTRESDYGRLWIWNEGIGLPHSPVHTQPESRPPTFLATIMHKKGRYLAV